jgi:hypothetical protein
MRTTIGLFMVAAFVGCGASPVTSDSQTDVRANSGGSQSKALTLQLDIPTPTPAGKPISLKLTLQNTSNEPVQVYLGGRPPYDFIVTSANGAELWRWSEGQVVQAILEVKTLGAREELMYDVDWALQDQSGKPLSPGTYLVRGAINLDPPERLETAPKQLVIASP